MTKPKKTRKVTKVEEPAAPYGEPVAPAVRAKKRGADSSSEDLEFQRLTDWIFAEHKGLLRKLAQ